MQHRVRVAIAINSLVTDDEERPVWALIFPLIVLALWLPVAEVWRVWGWAGQQARLFWLGLVVCWEALVGGGVYWRLRWAG